MKGGERGRGKIQAECRRQGMRPTHTPRNRGETTWQGHSWAWKGSCRVKVRWGSNLFYILGRCGGESLYAGDKAVTSKFRGVGIADEEIVHYKGEGGSGRVSMVTEKHGAGGFGVAMLGEESDKTKLGQEAGLGKARDSFKGIAKEEGFAVGVTEKRKETTFCEGGEGDRRYIYSYRFGGGKNSTYVSNSLSAMSIVARKEWVETMEWNRALIDCGEGGCVGSYLIVYVYPFSSYRQSHSPLPVSIHLTSHFAFTTRLR
jgi:hypothetical protein